nr:hypothetical protein [Vitiosangium sp. GDMCC 1.1324]
MSNMRQTLACVTRRASRSSRLKRRSVSGVTASSGRMVLSATGSWSERSSAAYTSPMPPRAMKRSTR